MISHADRLVVARAEGIVDLQAIESYLDTIVIGGALSYANLLDTWHGRLVMSDADFMALGARFSAYSILAPIGPLAIVVWSRPARWFAARYRNLTRAHRLVEVFSSQPRARSWLGTQASAK